MTMKDPRGEITIQTLAMPKDTNFDGNIFGGWIVSHMDIAAGIVAKRVAGGKKVVTVSIHSMNFIKPVHVADVVSCYVKLLKVGNTSITMWVEVWVKKPRLNEEYKVTEGGFIFVAVDAMGKPVPVQSI